MIPEEGEIEIYELTEDNLIMCCRDWQRDECICCLEKVGAMPGQGVTSMFTFADGVGFIRGCLRSHGIPFQQVTPQKWKSEFGCNLGKKATPKEKKAKDIETCHKLFPNVSLRRTERCKTDSDGFADALLMALYAKRKF